MGATKLVFLVVLPFVAHADLMGSGVGSITATALVEGLGGLACESTTTGTTSALASVGCLTSSGNFFTAKAQAQLGDIGPYGIGVSIDTRGSGVCCFEFGEGSVKYSYQQGLIIEGEGDSGFVVPEVSGICDFGPFEGRINVNIFGASFGSGCSYFLPGQGGGFVDPPIPVTFGVPYVAQISGSQACISIAEAEFCGDLQTYVSNLTITDALGNPLVIERVHDGVIQLAPEPGSILFLATVVIGVSIKMKLISQNWRGSGHAPSPDRSC